MSHNDKPHILVVNDDAGSLLALTSLLEQRAEAGHYKVLSARSGQEALRLVLLHNVAVILLEVHMPGMDGFETAEAIHQRARSADIPIIFVSAFLPDDTDRLKAYQRGGADILFTPVSAPILHAKVAVFVALALKNTELREQSRALRQRALELTAANLRLSEQVQERRDAERKDAANDEFLAMLGHELRNPLSAISSAASLLGLPGAGADGVLRAGRIIERQSQHLSRIVDDLLDLARAMSGKIVLTRQPLDLAAVVGACLDTLRATGRMGAFTPALRLAPCWVSGDPIRLEQIATNLIDNALKYTPAGGTIDIEVGTDPAQGQVVLRVTDTGVGIVPELLPHVFDVFVQGSISLDRAQGGLGIGLALVRRLVALHGGSVSATSAGSGRGSVFEMRLPQHQPAVPSAPPGAQRIDALASSVLLIEDNDDGRDMMATLLDAYGVVVHQAADGVQGVRMALACVPEVALVDIGLPGIDGYEVARRLRAQPSTHAIKLIALTGYGLAEDQRRVLAAGFDMHLVKPVDIERLLAAIRSTRR
ncbi:response regulator [Massilia sp. DWR3-1-1]|uniref:response regulator n=1 Tax=Massilia sp. DWR3-1-1 TaxID=2804559 RepID=UPI003CE9FFD7